MPRELNDRERLTIAQAFYKVIASAVSTKDPDNLRGRVDASMFKAYQTTGAKSFDLMLNGMKVGTYTLRFSKPVSETKLVIVDDTAFARWAYANQLAKKQIIITIDVEPGQQDRLIGVEFAITEDMYRRGVAQEHYIVSDDALAEAMRNGEVPDGCRLSTLDDPSHCLGSTLRVDERMVAQAMGEALPGALIGLLPEGGE